MMIFVKVFFLQTSRCLIQSKLQTRLRTEQQSSVSC